MSTYLLCVVRVLNRRKVGIRIVGMTVLGRVLFRGCDRLTRLIDVLMMILLIWRIRVWIVLRVLLGRLMWCALVTR